MCARGGGRDGDGRWLTANWSLTDFMKISLLCLVLAAAAKFERKKRLGTAVSLLLN